MSDSTEDLVGEVGTVQGVAFAPDPKCLVHDTGGVHGEGVEVCWSCLSMLPDALIAAACHDSIRILMKLSSGDLIRADHMVIDSRPNPNSFVTLMGEEASMWEPDDDRAYDPGTRLRFGIDVHLRDIVWVRLLEDPDDQPDETDE